MGQRAHEEVDDDVVRALLPPPLALTLISREEPVDDDAVRTALPHAIRDARVERAMRELVLTRIGSGPEVPPPEPRACTVLGVGERTRQPHRLCPPTSPAIEEDDLTEDDVDHIKRQILNLLRTVGEEKLVEDLCKSLGLHKPELFHLFCKVRLGFLAERARRAAIESSSGA